MQELSFHIIFISFLISLVASIIAVFLALTIEYKRLPKLVMVPIHDYVLTNNGNKRKSIRVNVLNTSAPWFLKLFRLPRQIAQSCKATLKFYDSNEKYLFSMLGRWISTPQICHIPQDMIKERVFYYPDPVNILEGKKEELDVAIQRKGDLAAYGCNNEAYLNNWETPQYRLSEGKYRVEIEITTQNGVIFNEQFILMVNSNLEGTVLSYY